MPARSLSSVREQATTLHQIVFPRQSTPDAVPLYLDDNAWQMDGNQDVRPTQPQQVSEILSRHSLRVPAGQTISLASYFNAFPASYWKRWTAVTSVTLTVRSTGQGEIIVFRSNAEGSIEQVDCVTVTGSGATSVFQLPLEEFDDGGWYWFDLVAHEQDLILDGADYSTQTEPVRRGKATVGITTFNRPEYCVEVIRALAEEPKIDKALDAICVVDQGAQRVSDQPKYAPVAKLLGSRLKYIIQPNLGGSGGFSRGMIEALERPESDFVLLLDDDVVVEPEGVMRAVTFGRYTREPTIVGGHMFDMYIRTQIHSWSERVDRNRFFWEPHDWSQFRHNFSQANLRQTPWAHRRADVDFNGWWMSLIPLEVVRAIGLSLPVFIKWDDAEYSLRATEFGFSTVTLPGAAVWHVSWQDKDDYKDWQAFFHARNRTVAALLHSPHKRGGKLIRHSLIMSIKHLFKMQYYTDEIYSLGLDDVLAGPAMLHKTMPTRLGDVRALASDYPEMAIIRDQAMMPEPLVSAENVPAYTPMTKFKLALWLLRNGPRQLRKEKSMFVGERPQVWLTSIQASWWALSAYDSALVDTADGTGKQHYRRSRAEFLRRFKRTRQQHRALKRAWPGLAASYRATLHDYTSVDAWKRTIGLK